MVSFAELKAKAEKAKDMGATKLSNTRDRLSSMPSSKTNWDPNWKRAPPSASASSPSPRASTSGPPPPPLRSRPDITPSDAGNSSSPAPSAYVPPPPPTRLASGYPPSSHQDEVDTIDWANLSREDKEAFFGWLDEFFSRYVGIEVGPKQGRGVSVVDGTQSAGRPRVNMGTRPQV